MYHVTRNAESAWPEAAFLGKKAELATLMPFVHARDGGSAHCCEIISCFIRRHDLNNMLLKLKKYFPDKNEVRLIRKILRNLDRRIEALDVGSGYGEKITVLKNMGFNNILGIEINPVIIEKDIKNNMNVVSPDEFERKYQEKKFDLVIMSHIIEHFSWEELLHFMDNYLEHLKQGGYCLIVTPILHGQFYNDFDHVKPYYPNALTMMFGNINSQLQIHSRNHLILENIYFRRSSLRIIKSRSLYIDSKLRVPIYINRFLLILFVISHGFIGKKSGWIGLYRKE